MPLAHTIKLFRHLAYAAIASAPEPTRSSSLGQYANCDYLININSLPMVVDIAPQDRLGTYTGLHYFFSTFAAILGPWLGGLLVDLTGRDYTMIFVIAPIGMLVAFLCMLGVRRGERAE